MTSRSRLSVLLVMVLLTLLSVLVYLQSPLQIGLAKHMAGEKFPTHQRHVSDVMRSTLLPHLLRNSTGRANSSLTDLHTVRPTVSFMVAKRKEMKTRRDVLRKACQHYGKQVSGDLRKHLSANIFVDDEHRVVYCAVPKIACTSWKKVFLVLNKSFQSTSEISQYFANRDGQKMLTRLKDLPPSEMSRVLKSYDKFLFARHPFSRVLSAFRNKLAPDSTFERAGVWQRTVGNRILGIYRENHQSSSDGYDLTFEEFIRYLTDPAVPSQTSSNKHWSKIFDQCLPCDIDYDIIGKFETLREDSEYILRLIHAEHVTFPGSESSSPTGSSNQTKLESYYKNVPLVDLQNLYKRFRVDFDLFGYDPPTLAFKGS
ncbi:carbohydrate sulfotransferase 13-like isoform X2 [Acanthaster planci]|nr:carbohydrate sulfotransferase 13-like isoform X2 [Acanthaster planci]XP_022084699.1 carbohydrate sulfotransferase 13-like isoform X2 [Acanthaster planci]